MFNKCTQKLINQTSEQTPRKLAHIAYNVSSFCMQKREDGDVCLKCGACGRKFKNGQLIKK